LEYAYQQPEKRGFRLNNAASSVEPERDKPEMKWRRFFTCGA
jgi:hypothetical protein